MMGLIKKIGSVGFTAAISAVLIVLLIVSTSMEAINGTPFAQKVFYQTRWFDFLVSMLWLNIFCSTVIRFPFKKSQIGFLITHVAILGLLAGALITRAYSVEGEMTVFEGETADSIRQDGKDLVVIFPNQEDSRFDLRKGMSQFVLTKERLNAGVPFCPLKPKKAGAAAPAANAEDQVSFNVVNIIQHASESVLVKPGDGKGPLNHALQVKLKSKNLGHDSLFWLVEHEPGNPSSDVAMAGPVKLALRRQMKAVQSKKPVLRVMSSSDQEIASIDVEAKDLSKKIPLAKTGWTIKDLEYYPYATVSGNKLINFPEGKRINPAVVYNLVDAKGVATRQVKFAYFPDFESMHPQSQDKKGLKDVKILFEAGEPEDLEGLFDGLQIAFHFDDNAAWQYQTKFQNKVLKEGEITIGQCSPAGWMDVEFCVQDLFSHAQVSYEIVPAKDDQGPLAVSVVVPAVSGTEVYWVLDNKTTSVHLPKGEVQFAISPKMLKLPFSVALKQFRKIDYPGTQDAASFESDVVLSDPVRGITLERMISMNRPLEYNGYKIFQSSYLTDQQYGKGSVFTVAKNPGIPWIYVSSIFAFIGASFLFYGREEKGAGA